MIFSLAFWPTALLFALLGTLVTFFVARPSFKAAPAVSDEERTEAALRRGYSRYEREERQRKSVSPVWLLAGTFLVSLLVTRIAMYYVQPVLQGAWFGYAVPLVLVTLIGCAVGLVVREGDFSAWKRAVPIALLVMGLPIIQGAWFGWGPYNGMNRASLPNVKVAAEDANIVPTDPDHLVLVTKTIAAFKGQTVLGGLGSKYKIDVDDYALQAVNKHRYWIAPLTLSNTLDTYNIGDPESPGYVVVDAENPEADAQLKLGFHIKLFNDQSWGLYVRRFAYQNGFSNGSLRGPKFEVDDNWQPHWVFGFYRNQFGDVAGLALEKVVLVNVANAEPTFTVFDPAKEQSKYPWVDRSVDYSVLESYATDWGWYHGEFAHQHPWKVFFKFDRTGTMRPAAGQLSYTTGEENVYVIPMQSTNDTDHGVLGVWVAETNRNEITFYPGLKGFNIGETVVDTMFHARDNIKGYQVEQVQLVNIYGELTYFAIYSSPQATGRSFAGVGLMHAHAQNSADVIFASTKEQALAKYATQLANRRSGGGHASQTVTHSQEVHGRILRIAAVQQSGQGNPTYQFKVVGDKHTFVVSSEVYGDIALVKDGDEVTFTFIDNNSKEVPVDSFHCKVLDENGVSTGEVERK